MSPVQADAAIEAVRHEIDELAAQCDAVAVIAFAQGAAVAHEAVRRGQQDKVRLFATIGSGLRKYHEIPEAADSGSRPWQSLVAVLFGAYFLLAPTAILVGVVAGSIGFWGTLLSIPGMLGHGFLAYLFFADQYGQSLVVDPRKYALPGAGRRFVWVDYYASADPVPNGPVADPDSGGALPGWPCEVLVYNRASWFSDHRRYLTNVEELFGDLVPRLMDLGGRGGSWADRQPAAAARRRWRVRWLAAARALVTVTTVLMVLSFLGDHARIGAGVLDFLPGVVRKLGSLAAEPFSKLPLPSLSAAAVGVLSVVLAGWVVYALLVVVWRRWEHRDGETFFSGADFDAGGRPFGVFLVGTAVVAVAALEAATSLWFEAHPLAELVASVGALPWPSKELLVTGVAAFLAVALLLGAAPIPFRKRPAGQDPRVGGVLVILRLFLAGPCASMVVLGLVEPTWVWLDDAKAPERPDQLVPILVGALAGLVVGETARRVRYLSLVRIAPWLARRSTTAVPVPGWGRTPRGAVVLRTVPTVGSTVRLSGDGRYLVTASAHRTVVHDTGTGRIVNTTSWPEPVGAIAVSDEVLAVATGGDVVLQAAADGTELVRWAHENVVTGLAFASDGQLLLTIDLRGGVRLWDSRQRLEVWRHSGDLHGHGDLGPDGLVATISYGNVRIWCPDRGSWALTPEQPAVPRAVRVAVDAAGVRLAITTADDTVVVWDRESGAEVARRHLPDRITAVRPHPIHPAVAIAAGHHVHLWYPDEPERDVRVHHEWGVVTDLDLSRDGRHVVTIHRDGVTAIWRWHEAPG
jgi:hypothetical protein